MKRVKKDNPKLTKFTKLTKQLMALGFDSIVVIGLENNEVKKDGKTYLAVHNVVPKLERDHEKAIIRLINMVGTRPAEMKTALDSLHNLAETGNLSNLLDKLKDELSESATYIKEQADAQEAKESEENVDNWKPTTPDSETPIDNIIKNFTDELESMIGVPQRDFVKDVFEERKKNMDKAEKKLSKKNKKKLEELRKLKNEHVRNQNYEAACNARMEERKLLGIE